MKLVEFLVAGVAGAESGTATFVLRGTASSAAANLYNDFEGTAQPGTNIITLDARGAAEVYTNVYVDITIKTSAGATMRTVTVGDNAALVEVRSDSFTGTDYDGSPANTVSNPITLAAILDKWNDSSGSTNWKVLVGGVATNLSSAFAAVAGLFVNVKDPQYGALGDGVTDDTAAVNAAIVAAAGGIVFFPTGTYKVSALITSGTKNCNLLGAGPDATIISGNSALSSFLDFVGGTDGGWRRISGIKFASSATYGNIFTIDENKNVYVHNCEFDGTNVSGYVVDIFSTAGLSNVIFEACKFTMVAATDGAIRNNGNLDNKNVLVSNCVFVIGASFTGTVLKGPDFNVRGCTFDASAVTSGAYYHIDAIEMNGGVTYQGLFVGNKFLDGGSTGFVFKLTTVFPLSNFKEDDNIFKGFTAATITGVGHIYDLSFDATHSSTATVVLGSRKGKSLAFTNAASSNILPTCHIVADTIVINHTNASNLTVQAQTPELPPGAEYVIVIQNNSGGARTISFLDSGDTRSELTVPDGGYALAHYRWYLETVGAERCCIDVTRQGSI